MYLICITPGAAGGQGSAQYPTAPHCHPPPPPHPPAAPLQYPVFAGATTSSDWMVAKVDGLEIGWSRNWTVSKLDGLETGWSQNLMVSNLDGLDWMVATPLRHPCGAYIQVSRMFGSLTHMLSSHRDV